MKQILIDFVIDILRQLFGGVKPREGRIELTHRAVNEMYQSGLYPELIRDIFKYGVETKKGLIVRKYAKYIAGIYYKYDGIEDVYRITFVYKS